MVGAVQSRVLNEDIETVEESPRGRAAACVDLSGGGDGSLLFLTSFGNKRMPESDLMHDYAGNWTGGAPSAHSPAVHVPWGAARYTNGAGKRPIAFSG